MREDIWLGPLALLYASRFPLSSIDLSGETIITFNRYFLSVVSEPLGGGRGRGVFLGRAIAGRKPHFPQRKLSLHPYRARLPLVVERQADKSSPSGSGEARVGAAP